MILPFSTQNVTRMTDTNVPIASSAADNAAVTPAVSFSQGQARVGQLLAELSESAPAAEEGGQAGRGDQQTQSRKFENQLALARLGIATSLFLALRAKHAATAAHSLRVALSCSAWADRLGLDDASRDRIEVAALLHDLGKIGIPDRILRKPGKLSVEEQLTMDGCPGLACEMLRGCTSDVELLEIVSHAGVWYGSRRQGESPSGDALPLGARMLAIANAFDAMTTDSVYRRAMSRERAVQELHRSSGTQFDPELVSDFSRMFAQRPEMLQGVIVDRWLQQLQSNSADNLWESPKPVGTPRSTEVVRRETRFLQQLIGNLKDGVAFTDNEGTITHWNGVMHEMSSIAASAIVGQTWSSECIRLRERDCSRIEDSCMVAECLLTGASVARPMLIEQPGSDPTPVHVHVSPVVGDVPGMHGTVVIIRDLTDQADLEEQVESLHYQTIRDPLTGIANRAHFDATLSEFVSVATSGGNSFSLIICDIDHFKRVNDVHGHPAGDEALVSFASILSSHSRDGDLVARYGGEEFLLLALKCDNATATQRAEMIRSALERTPLPSIDGASVTASFGVTEFQSGDTAATVLSRADRALLKAKDSGRNRVVQLGSGLANDAPVRPSKRSWLRWFDSQDGHREHKFNIATPVPVDLAIEKLRGFIADHTAEIISVTENQVSLKVRAICSAGGRRRVDQHIDLRVQLTLNESQNVVNRTGTAQGYAMTNVLINLEPIRNRDRRSLELDTCIDQVVTSLRSYLIGEIVPGE